MTDEHEIGRGSLWLLRAGVALVTAVVVFFLVDAILG